MGCECGVIFIDLSSTTCEEPLLAPKVKMTATFSRESVNTSIQNVGYESLLVTGLNVLQSTQKRRYPSFLEHILSVRPILSGEV